MVGLFGYVRGERLDNGGNLYQIMPVYGRLGLEHRRGNWSNGVDFQAVDAKKKVQPVREILAELLEGAERELSRMAGA